MSHLTEGPTLEYEKATAQFDEKKADKGIDVESSDSVDEDSHLGVLEDARDIATTIVSVADDPSLGYWTIRAFIIGIGLSAFGGVLGKCLLALYSILSYNVQL